MSSNETQSRRSLEQLVRRFVAAVLKHLFGVRGSLKPPLGGPHAGRLYHVRYRAWNLTNRLYYWSGLSSEWRAWYDAERDRLTDRRG